MFKHQQYSYSFGRGRRFAFLLVCIAVLLAFLVPASVSAQPTGYQEYYVLGYEEHVWQAFLAINDNPDPQELQDGNICSTVSLVATADHQVVYYDQWEDGYEADLLNPTQSSTEIYGDGDPSNGGSGDDILLAGDGISLTSDQDITGTTVITGYVPVSSGRNPNYIRYDGGDRIITSGGPVDLTHAMWPLGASWVGGAWEVYSRQAYANTFSYHLPIGEDLYTFGGGDTGTYGDFRNVYLQLGAFEDNTTISIENGSREINLTLDRGQTYFSRGYINSTPAPTVTVNSGTVIRSSNPTQVGLITGADGRFQGRFLIVLPDQEWGADYVVPVPRGVGLGDDDGHQDAPAEIYLSNPNNFPIEIEAYDSATQTTFVISPTDFISATVPYSPKRGGLYVPQDSAARFTSSDGVFGVVVCADTSRIDYDWGFAGIPAQYLTSDYYVPWAPGTTDLSANGSPVWVTPLANDTTFYVDYSPLDGLVDRTFTLDVLAQQRISDTLDNDNTGMHVWATDKFAIAWGEDPRAAGASNPYLDLGFAILPLQQRWLDPVLTLDNTADPTILPPAGGSVTFTLVAQAYSAPLVNVDLTDTLPISWTYVPGSSHVIYGDGSSGTPSPTIDDQTLFWDLSTDLDLAQSLTLTFQAQITNTSGISVSVNQGEATGKHEYSDVLFAPTADAAVYISLLNLTKSVNNRYANIGDTLVYTLSYVNRSATITAADVSLRDVLPVQHVTFLSASNGGVYDPASGTVTWTVGALAPGSGDAVTMSVTVNSFVEDGLVIENVGYISSQGMATAGSNAVRTTVRSPDIEFAKSGPTAAGQGEVITYTLSYKNSGCAAATGVTISDTVPLSTTYVTGSLSLNEGSGWVGLTDAADGDRGAYISTTLVITPGTVAAGEGGQIRFSVQIDGGLSPGSSILNSATLDRALDIPRESNLMITRISDLLLSKAAQQEAVTPGGVISYTLTYENASSTLTQTNVYVREPIPDYTGFFTVTETGGGAFEYSWDHGATWSATRPLTPVTHIRWYDAQMPPNTQATVGFAVRVNDTLPPDTTIQNMAHVSSTETAYLGWVPSNQVEVETVDLWVEKSAGQPTARPGGTITYTISYGNRGSADVTGVRITDTIPFSATYAPGSIWGAGADDSGNPVLSWNVMTVTNGASAQQVGYAVLLDSSLPDGSIVTNTAAIGSAYGVQVSEPVTVAVTAVAADLALSQTDFPDPVFAGAALTYTIAITNDGPSDAHGVSVTDLLPGSVTFNPAASDPGCTESPPGAIHCNVGVLAAGDGAIVTLVVGVDPSLADGAILTNWASVTGDETDPDGDNDSDIEYTTVAREADLAVFKSDCPDPVLAGAALTYTLTVTNTGPSDGSGVRLFDILPGGVTFTAASDPGCAETSGTVNCGLGNLAAGDSKTVTIIVSVDSSLADGAILTNRGLVAGNEDDPNGSNNWTSENTAVNREADLAIFKTARPDYVLANSTLTYTLVYTNSGPSDARDVYITDTLPVSVTYGGVVSAMPPLSGPAQMGNLLTWYTPTLAAGAAGSIVFTVTVNADAVDSITNSVTITSSTPDPHPENNSAEKSVIVNILMDITKSALDLNGAPLYPGDEIEYRVVVTNTTIREQHNVVVVDSAPANTTLAADSATCTAGALCWTVGGVTGQLLGPSDFGGMAVATQDSLAPGQALTLTFRVRVNYNVSAVGGNIAVTDSDDQETQESALVYPPGGGAVEPGLAIAKTALSLNGALETGDTIEYRIVVTNTNATWGQTNVIISDTVPANTTFVAGSVACSPGGNCSENGGVLIAAIGSLAPGGVFTLTFRVTVDGDVSSIGVNIAAVESDNQNEQMTGPVYPPSGMDAYIYLPLIARNYRARR